MLWSQPMSDTPNLNLPYIAASQAQKHITHNDAIQTLDTLVQMGVLTRNLTVAPVSPSEGDRHIVGLGASGIWAGNDHSIATFSNGGWLFYPPKEGWLTWIESDVGFFVWGGSSWDALTAAGASETALKFGVNATADLTNLLVVKSDAVLFSHDDITPGNGSIQHKLNKSAALKTASFLFQDNWSGRAEIGLMGDDDFHFKVSPDGAAWHEALVINKANGRVTFPNSTYSSGQNTNFLINSDFQINQRAFGGGALAAATYGHDRWKAAAGGANYSVSASTVTLASGEIEQIIETDFWNISSFASKQVTISLNAPSEDITVTFGSQSGTILAGAGRQSVTLSMGAGDVGNLSFKLKRASAGSVSFQQIKLELGEGGGIWVPRNAQEELFLASRYYTKSYEVNTAPGTATSVGSINFYNNATTSSVGFISFSVTMRALPSRTIYNPVSGAAGSIRTNSSNRAVSGGVVGVSGISAVYGSGFTISKTGNFQFTAEAEL